MPMLLAHNHILSSKGNIWSKIFGVLFYNLYPDPGIKF